MRKPAVYTKKIIIFFFSVMITAVIAAPPKKYDPPGPFNPAVLSVVLKEGFQSVALLAAKADEMTNSGLSKKERVAALSCGTGAFIAPIITGFFVSQWFEAAATAENFDDFANAVEGIKKLYGGLIVYKLSQMYGYANKQAAHADAARKKKLIALTATPNQTENKIAVITNQVVKNIDITRAKDLDEMSKRLTDLIALLASDIGDKAQNKSFLKHIIEISTQTGREGLEAMVIIAVSSIYAHADNYPFKDQLWQSIGISAATGIAIPVATYCVPKAISECIRHIKKKAREDSEITIGTSEFCECDLLAKILYQYSLLEVFLGLFSGALFSYGAHEIAEALHWDVPTWDLVGDNRTVWYDEKQPAGSIISALVPYDTDPTAEQAVMIIGFWTVALGRLLSSFYSNLWGERKDAPCCICNKQRTDSHDLEEGNSIQLTGM